LVINNHLHTVKVERIEVNNIFIFDWDDTFLSTSHLTTHESFKEEQKLMLADKEIKLFKDIEDLVVKILEYAISKGHTYIITNGAKGWVEYTACMFYPRVARVLGKMCVISARSEYEKEYPTESKMWKTYAFLNLPKVFNVKALTNIICVGDSMVEIEASKSLASKFDKCFLKSIKFRENPKPEEIIKQLKLVNSQLGDIYSAAKSLSINVELRQKDSSRARKRSE